MKVSHFALGAIGIALLRLLLLNSGLDEAELILLGLGVGYFAWRDSERISRRVRKWKRVSRWLANFRPRRLPKTERSSIALARTVEDGPARALRLDNELHHQSRQHPISFAHVAHRPLEADANGSDAARYQFTHGLPEAGARSGRSARDRAFNGTGCVVKELPEREYLLHGPIADAWRRDLEREAQLEERP